MSRNQKSLNQIISYRLEKLKQLKEMGINPYPHKYSPTHFSSDIINDFSNLNEGIEVIYMGNVLGGPSIGSAGKVMKI